MSLPRPDYSIRWHILSDETRLRLAELGLREKAHGVEFSRPLHAGEMLAVGLFLADLVREADVHDRATYGEEPCNHARFAIGDWANKLEEWCSREDEEVVGTLVDYYLETGKDDKIHAFFEAVRLPAEVQAQLQRIQAMPQGKGGTRGTNGKHKRHNRARRRP